jgi:hypothetical protein
MNPKTQPLFPLHTCTFDLKTHEALVLYPTAYTLHNHTGSATSFPSPVNGTILCCIYAHLNNATVMGAFITLVTTKNIKILNEFK